MILERERILGFGITAGLVLGFVLGSVVARAVGDRSAVLLRRWLARLLGREERVNFELLLQ
ncbi:MAG TPA: hypothetical protein VIN09_03100 [Chloroflexota bacterium]|jgi:hypothetical protein